MLSYFDNVAQHYKTERLINAMRHGHKTQQGLITHHRYNNEQPVMNNK
jgi:hypothetical protein